MHKKSLEAAAHFESSDKDYDDDDEKSDDSKFEEAKSETKQSKNRNRQNPSEQTPNQPTTINDQNHLLHQNQSQNLHQTYPLFAYPFGM